MIPLCFALISSNQIAFKNDDDDTNNLPSNVKAMDYVACKYDANWWIGIVLAINDDEQDLQIQFCTHLDLNETLSSKK